LNVSSTEAQTPDPATCAQALLREFEETYDVSDVPPVPVERIARSLLGLYIDEHDDLRTLPNAPADQGHLSGMLDPEDMVIWVDRGEARRSPRRKRFTIAHEVGHFRMHLSQFDGVFADRPRDIIEIPGSRTGAPDLPQRERDADAFARELLMPELLMRENAISTGFNLSALAERFDVSVPAIRLRLRLLGILPRHMA
jgi:hypothetical protein